MEIRYGKKVAKIIACWKPDAVISGNTPTATQEPLTLAAAAGGWVGAWYRHLGRRQFKRSSKVIANTEDFTPILSRELGVDPANVAVVPNWAHIEEIPVQPKETPWTHRHRLHYKFAYLYSGTSV